MTKSLSSIPNNEKRDTILRRLLSRTKGIGFWAAMDARRYARISDAELGNPSAQKSSKDSEARKKSDNKSDN